MDFNLLKLQEKAINQALKGSWEEAIKTNLEIQKLTKDNIDVLLRLGYSYLQVGEYEEAKKSYLKALKIQPGNQIAKNNLEKIKILSLKKGKHVKNTGEKENLNPSLFLNVSGKTKIVALVNIGQANVLARLEVGEKTILKIKKRKIEVRNKNDEYIGAFPDDLSKRIMFFLENDSEYLVYIKESSKNCVEVFIKEERKGKKVEKFISFPKDIQENLKNITDENIEDNKKTDEDSNDEEVPFDIEKLAEELAETEKENFGAQEHFEEEKEEFDE